MVTGLETFANYRPQFFVRTANLDGALEFDEGTTMVLPGDSVELGVRLGRPVALEVGLGFAVREGNRTVAAGAVGELL